MNYRAALLTCLLSLVYLTPGHTDDRLELETTFIKGNKEMPQIIYVVPWKDLKKEQRREQTLVLHSLFGDLFEPVYVDIKRTNP